MVTRIDTLNDIVDDLLLFARPRPVVPTRVMIADLLGEITALLKGPALHGDPLPDRRHGCRHGRRRRAAQARAPEPAARLSGGWHELRIIDQGPGILPSVQEHLFEPFFTTKHRGTGLGLAPSRRIVENHGGTITLESPPGGGTVALIRLPAR